MEFFRLSLLLYYFIFTLIWVSSAATEVIFIEYLTIYKIWIIFTELIKLSCSRVIVIMDVILLELKGRVLDVLPKGQTIEGFFYSPAFCEL